MFIYSVPPPISTLYSISIFCHSLWLNSSLKISEELDWKTNKEKCNCKLWLLLLSLCVERQGIIISPFLIISLTFWTFSYLSFPLFLRSLLPITSPCIQLPRIPSCSLNLSSRTKSDPVIQKRCLVFPVSVLDLSLMRFSFFHFFTAFWLFTERSWEK